MVCHGDCQEVQTVVRCTDGDGINITPCEERLLKQRPSKSTPTLVKVLVALAGGYCWVDVLLRGEFQLCFA